MEDKIPLSMGVYPYPKDKRTRNALWKYFITL